MTKDGMNDELDRAFVHQQIPQRKQSKQVKVVVRSKRLTSGEYILMGLYALGFCLALFFVIHMSAEIDGINRNIESVKTEMTEQQMVNENLAYQKMELSNPERILAVAKEHGLDIQNTKVKQASKVN
ncbi:cell division protein FtsL [Halolactibacillus sp. JCM 19043]|uniref:cell division protein FtsL n=1 Tax=Halolactibacillus sp. JCM 19043 TaxID=1460638 RepID=UPI00078610CC|nr:cell division protein FtsL [Halolactibacillus sp. JCM 19043]